MDPEKTTNPRLEVTRGIKDGKAGIDRNHEDDKYRGVIRGFAVMTKGNVKDSRNWEIDDKTLEQIVKAGNQHKKMGLKSRFGHPNMSATALGTFLGRTKNFYVDGDTARADLYFSKTAYETPDGDLASYVLGLAETDPAAFGTSVVLGDFELADKLDDDGIPTKKDGRKIRVLRVKSLLAVDAVDDPAANNSLFGTFFNANVELSATASEFLDKLLNTPDAIERVIAFLERYRVNRVEIDEPLGKLGQPEPGAQVNTKKEEGMEMKDLTLEVLSKERPDLLAANRNEAVAAERKRALDITKAAHAEFKGMGMEGLADESIEKGHTLDAALAAMRGKRVKDLEAASNMPPGPDADAGAGKLSHVERANAYKLEHKCSMVEALKATQEASKK